MFKMVFKNLTGQFKKQRMLSALLVLNIIVSCLVICFSYGLYQNYNVVIKEGESEELKELYVYTDKEHNVPPSDKTDVRSAADISPSMFMDMMKSWSDDTKSNIEDVTVEFIVETPMSVNYDNNAADEWYSDDKEPYYMTVGYHIGIDGDKFIDTSRAGQYFTEEQYNSGEKMIVLDESMFSESNISVYSESVYIDDEVKELNWAYRHIPSDADHVIIGGESYRIIGNMPTGTLPKYVAAIPLPALSDKAKVELGSAHDNTDKMYRSRCCIISFNEPVTREQYADIKDSLSYLGSDVYLQDIQITEAKEIYYYKTIMLISVVIAVLAAINMAILYRYILEKRSSHLAIFRICGCSKGGAVASYLLECLLINIPLFILTQLVYHKLIMPRLTSLFPNMAGAYSFKLYAAIFDIYITASTLVMLVMIIHTVRSHSLVALKSAGKSTGKAGGIMKVFEVIQLAAVLSMMVIIVSAINSRYALYTPFEKYFDRKGYLVAAADPMTYDKDFESVAGTSDIIMSQQTSRVIGDVSFDGIAYDDEFIESYAPPLEDGVWLSDTDITYEKDGYIPAVITYCGGRYKVGDELTQEFQLSDNDGNLQTITEKVKIIGILKDKASIASYVLDKPLAHEDHRDIYNVFSDGFEENDWLLTRLSDEYACFKGSGVVWGTQFVFYDGLSDEEFARHGDDLNRQFTATKLSVIRKNSMKYIYAQMYTLFPIAVCIFILTIISTVSISAIYTKRQLRNYAIFYICGARWRTCALRSLKNSAITCGIASILAAAVLIVGKLTFFKETVISFGWWHFGVCAGVIALYLALSMIMPLMIIGSNQPKEVLKED